jgi:hypothetical protein
MRSSLKEAIFALERMTWKIPTSSCAPPDHHRRARMDCRRSICGPRRNSWRRFCAGALILRHAQYSRLDDLFGNPAMPLRERKIRFD